MRLFRSLFRCSRADSLDGMVLAELPTLERRGWHWHRKCEMRVAGPHRASRGRDSGEDEARGSRLPTPSAPSGFASEKGLFSFFFFLQITSRGVEDALVGLVDGACLRGASRHVLLSEKARRQRSRKGRVRRYGRPLRQVHRHLSTGFRNMSTGGRPLRRR